MQLRSWMMVFAAAAMAASCGGKKTVRATGGSGVTTGEEFVMTTDAPPGLTVQLGEGADTDDAVPRPPAADAQKLTDKATRALLSRLPALVAEADDEQAFSLRARSAPPPRTGDVIDAAFPPKPGGAPPAGAVDRGPLEVVRFSPEGDVPLAPHVSVTFSQPMVAVTSHAQASQTIPVTVSPAVEGTWRWVGTRTLLLDPATRLPMATAYRVEVAEGVESATGGRLAKAMSWQFTTPPPQVKAQHPTGGPHVREPIAFVLFDQAIDRDAVLATVTMKTGKRNVAVRAANADEIAADAEVRARVEAAKRDGHDDRWIAFRPVEPLPTDTQVTVNIGPGTPSAEGPLETTEAQTFSFRTYAALKVVESRCAWGNAECPPTSPWYIRFNNPLDADAFAEDAIGIEPSLPARSIQVHGDALYIQGRSKGRTTYVVTVPASLTDRFGQTLGRDERLKFRVGSAEPTLYGPQGVVVLDPAAKPGISVFSINNERLRVRLYAVEPGDWPAFAAFMQKAHRQRELPTPPGKRVSDAFVNVDGERDALAETRIDLSGALKGGRGHVIAIVEPQHQPKDHWRRQTLVGWYQATDIGVDAFVDSRELYAWTTSLSDGKPLSGVTVSIEPGRGTATTAAEGTATIPLPSASKSSSVLVARKGGDSAILPEHTYWWGDHTGWVQRDPGDTLHWFTFDDRAMYRPGETVRVKGWLRRVTGGKGSDLAAVPDAVNSVRYLVRGPQGNEIGKGTATINAAGGFDLAVELPKTPNLGYAHIELTAVGKGGDLAGRTAHHSFQIQEFRRPEFEVTTSASEGPHLLGGHADVTVDARYYAGGPLPGAEVNWGVRSQPGHFTPPNWDEFSFGTWVPWWRPHYDGGNTNHAAYAGKTDATGAHHLRVDFVSMNPPRPMAVVAEASVTDVNRQTWTSAANLLVHPSTAYVGLRGEKMFVDRGTPLEIDAIAVDLDGKPLPGTAIEVSAARIEWRYEKGEWVEKEREPQTCAVTAKAEPVRCTFETKEGGQYKIVAKIADERGRPNQSELTRWVSGGKRPPARNVELEEVTLVPDKETYAPGETARIFVQAPFAPAEGLITYRRGGLEHTERFRMAEPTHTLNVKLDDRYTPNLHVQVDVVGAAPRLSDEGEPVKGLPPRPAFAKGSIELSIPPVKRTLAVTATPRAARLEPGGKTTVDLTVRDAAGKPVRGAEVAVVVVDEAVLALSNYQTPDPLSAFYFNRGPGVSDHHLRSLVTLARPDREAFPATEEPADDEAPPAAPREQREGRMRGAADGDMAMAESAAAPMAGKMSANLAVGGGGQGQPPIAVRTNFAALATFAPEVKTDARGKASVAVTLPDNLTRYRVMAIAVAGTREFGKGESTITARMPLMARPSPPRFLNFGDRFELPVVLQNQTDDPMTVTVAVRATNAALTDGGGRRVTVAANDRVEVRFPAAAREAGTARFQIAAAAGAWTDAAELSLPVYTPATTEAFATYGEIDSGAVRQPIDVPDDVILAHGGLEISTASTQLQSLTDAFVYLVTYPYECSEQVASRMLSIAALRDVLSAFEAEGLPEPAALEERLAADVKLLAMLQNHDGGFAFWRQGDPSWPYLTVHVTHALARAKAKGYDVPERVLSQATGYLAQIDRHIPPHYPDDVRRSIRAYALYVRAHLGDRNTGEARALIREAGGAEKLPLEAVGWVLYVLADDAGSRDDVVKIHRLLGNRATDTAAAATFASSYADGAHLILHSSRRTDAVLLEALIASKPKSDLIPKVTRGLLAHRTRGRWGNTQENVFVLLAMDRYFHTYEKTTPRFMARAWLGDGLAGEHRFAGRQTDRFHVSVPMSWLAQNTDNDLTLAKQGAGRMYYRVGMIYAPKDLTLAPADHGFAVERVYEPVDDPGDVTRDADGTWRIKAGAKVRVRVTMVAESRRYHVALVDPLPAGLEPLNPALAVTGAIPQDPKGDDPKAAGYWWWWRPWYEHQNMRDDRVEAFSSLVWAGVHEYSYVARATTPGNFVVPPAKAEEMYHPETFGRSGSTNVIVE